MIYATSLSCIRWLEGVALTHDGYFIKFNWMNWNVAGFTVTHAAHASMAFTLDNVTNDVK